MARTDPEPYNDVWPPSPTTGRDWCQDCGREWPGGEAPVRYHQGDARRRAAL